MASIWRANCGRVAVRHARAQEKKKRCGTVDAVDDGGGLRGEALLGQGCHPRLPGDRHAAQVADVLTDGQGAVNVGERAFDAFLAVAALFLIVLGGQEDGGREDVVLPDERVGAFLEGGAVLVGPPVRQVTATVIAGALVVEAMADLVADDRADCAEVHCVIGLGVKERGLEDCGGEHDFVLRGVVVGVDGLGRHVPFVAVDGAPELVPFAVGGVGAGGADVVHERSDRVQVQRRVVAPLDGVADLRVEGRQLGQRLLLRLFTHPVEAANRFSVCVKEAAHQRVHRVLRVGWEMAGHPGAPHGLAQVRLDEGQRALPTRAQLLRARQGAAVEVEVLLDEVGREQGGARVDG